MQSSNPIRQLGNFRCSFGDGDGIKVVGCSVSTGLPVGDDDDDDDDDDDHANDDDDDEDDDDDDDDEDNCSGDSSTSQRF